MKKTQMTALCILLSACSLFSAGIDWKNFRIELMGGFSLINPVDLNLRSQADEAVYFHQHDDYYAHLASQGGPFIYSKLNSDRFPIIKHSYSLGIRVKYHLNQKFGISLGFKYLSRNLEKEVINQFSFPYDYGEQQYHHIWSPYILNVRGGVPFFGLFASFPLKGRISAGCFIEGGPLFGSCFFAFKEYEEWHTAEGRLAERSSSYFLEENGSGTGISAEGGLRILWHLGRFSPFIEGSYSYRKINTLYGPGIEESGGVLEDNWEGDWGIKQARIEDPWGNMSYQFPSNYWEGDPQRHRDFNLDLSGFLFRIGISFGF